MHIFIMKLQHIAMQCHVKKKYNILYYKGVLL